MLALGVSSRLLPVGRAFAAALVVAVLLGGCAAANSAESRSATDPAGSGSPAAAPKCGPDEGMGRVARACKDDRPKVVQHRPRYKSDQGEAAEQYLGYTYHGESYEYCKARLAESFQAYKACIRY